MLDARLPEPNGTSFPVTVNVAAQAPAFFLWPENQAVATQLDGSFVAKPGTFVGATTAAAHPGDVLVLWGTGFGAHYAAGPAGYRCAVRPAAQLQPGDRHTRWEPGQGLRMCALGLGGELSSGDPGSDPAAGRRLRTAGHGKRRGINRERYPVG